MGKVRVKIGNSTPPKEVIRKYKDYNKFRDNYKKYYSTKGIRYMLYNDRKKLAFIVILIVFLLLMLFAE